MFIQTSSHICVCLPIEVEGVGSPRCGARVRSVAPSRIELCAYVATCVRYYSAGVGVAAVSMSAIAVLATLPQHNRPAERK